MSARKKKPKLRPTVALRLHAYSIISDKVEEGVRYGYARAYKHEDAPARETVEDRIAEAVMVALSDVIDWGDS